MIKQEKKFSFVLIAAWSIATFIGITLVVISMHMQSERIAAEADKTDRIVLITNQVEMPDQLLEDWVEDYVASRTCKRLGELHSGS